LSIIVLELCCLVTLSTEADSAKPVKRTANTYHSLVYTYWISVRAHNDYDAVIFIWRSGVVNNGDVIELVAMACMPT
jgi:hypothetical protein